MNARALKLHPVETTRERVARKGLRLMRADRERTIARREWREEQERCIAETDCPYPGCWAPAGVPCRTLTGRPRDRHDARWFAYAGRDDA